jgi:hypothetical protein
MAHGVKGNAILKVQQTLHGYADGHRQLASSVTLKPRDIKTMLVLSDISGPGARIDEQGYLTGYPLPESTMYALARTWGAPEMPRPGCVWTHTLLIDFADLATLASPALLVSLFRRPKIGDVADYGTSLSVVAELSDLDLTGDAVNFAGRLLASLYGKPTSRVIAARPAALNVDPVLMAIWGQQWPRLRRAFRFCTLSAADRSTESNVFDLQLLPSLDRSVRARFQEAVEARDIGPVQEDWLEDAISDLAQPDVAGLRMFLRRIGGDVDPGRDAFRLLCRLHVLTKRFNTNPNAVGGAIALLEDELGSSQARTARGLVVNAALETPDQLDDAALDFVVRHLEFAEPDTVSRQAGILGRTIWKRDPDRFARMVEGSDLHRSISAGAVAAMPMDELIDGIVHAPSLFDVALAQRPELVAQPAFWSHDTVPIGPTFAALAKSEELRAACVAAIIAAGRNDLAAKVVREFGSLNVLEVLASQFKTVDDGRRFGPWLTAAASEPATVAQFLASGQGPSWLLLSAIAHVMSPDSIPNDCGVDPWLIAVQAANRSPSDEMDLFLRAYVLSRALGSRSRNPGELAQFGFEPVYIATRANRLPDGAWRVFEHRLPWSFRWFEWDRCPRILTAIGELFVDRNLSAELFAQIASDDHVFAATAETVARSGRGRNYLKRVYGWMMNEGSQRYAARIRVIEGLVH